MKYEVEKFKATLDAMNKEFEMLKFLSARREELVVQAREMVMKHLTTKEPIDFDALLACLP